MFLVPYTRLNHYAEKDELQFMSMERRYVPGTLYKVKPLCNAPYTTHCEVISVLKLR